MAKGAASRKHHNGRIEQRSPPPQCSPCSSASASACPLVVSNCTRESQVANLSVIILKAKETWANLYASIREGRRELKALAGKARAGRGERGHRGWCNHLLRCFRTRISLWLIIVRQTVGEAARWAGAGGKLWNNTQADWRRPQQTVLHPYRSPLPVLQTC